MLEAAYADLVSPSAWSAAPYFSAIYKLAGRLPHLSGVKRTFSQRLPSNP